MELQGPYNSINIANRIGVNEWRNSETVSCNNSADPIVEPVGALKHLLYRLEQVATTIEVETGSYASVLWEFAPLNTDQPVPENAPVKKVPLSEMNFYERMVDVLRRLEESAQHIANYNREFDKLL